jgi:hypothetical protein
MNRLAQLHLQALGFLFFASYDSQGYGGGIQPHLHMGCFVEMHVSTILEFDSYLTEDTLCISIEGTRRLTL